MCGILFCQNLISNNFLYIFYIKVYKRLSKPWLYYTIIYYVLLYYTYIVPSFVEYFIIFGSAITRTIFGYDFLYFLYLHIAIISLPFSVYFCSVDSI